MMGIGENAVSAGQAAHPHRPEEAPRVRPAELSDAAALADLVERNRVYFRSGLPARDDSFYTPEGQRDLIERTRESGRAIVYVIEAGSTVAGSMVLAGIVRDYFQSAYVGYAVDEALTGRGIATSALQDLVSIAWDELNLHRLEAQTTIDNVASQKVLTRCGFVHFGRAPDFLMIDGRWQTHDLFQIINPNHRPSPGPS